MTSRPLAAPERAVHPEALVAASWLRTSGSMDAVSAETARERDFVGDIIEPNILTDRPWDR